MKARYEFANDAEYLAYLYNYTAMEFMKQNADNELESDEDLNDLVDRSFRMAELMSQRFKMKMH